LKELFLSIIEWMTKTSETRVVTADEIAEMADNGEDISRFYTGEFKMMPPLVKRVNVDFTGAMVEELDGEAAGLNISRQAVIKTLVRRALASLGVQPWRVAMRLRRTALAAGRRMLMTVDGTLSLL